MPKIIALICGVAAGITGFLSRPVMFQTVVFQSGAEAPPKSVLPASPGWPREGAGALAGQQVVAVLDIAHASQFSQNMTQRSVTDAAQWLVTQHLSKAAAMGVTLVILKHPYRWRPEPLEDYRFGGIDPARRTALHSAILSARTNHLPMPRLCAYQALPAGNSLSSSDQAILNAQAAAFDEDAWEAIGCKPWQQVMIDQRRQTRVQHLEPVWDIAFPAQWTYGIDVTELFLSTGLTQYQFFPSPRPEVRCWFHRPLVPQSGETPRDTYARTVRSFHAYCLPKGYTPVDPLDIFTELGVTPGELYAVECWGDYNGDGFVNGDDFDSFVDDFEAGERYCDFNGDGYVNGLDFDLYMPHWLAGC